MLALNDISTHSENEAFVDNICLMDGWRTRLPRLIDHGAPGDLSCFLVPSQVAKKRGSLKIQRNVVQITSLALCST